MVNAAAEWYEDWYERYHFPKLSAPFCQRINHS